MISAVLLSDATAGALGDAVGVSFTLANPWPSNGMLVVLFPAQFDLTTMSATATGSADGTYAVVRAGQAATITRTGTTSSPSGTAQTVTLTNMTNGGASGPTGSFILTTTTGAGAQIDTGTAAGVTLN